MNEATEPNTEIPVATHVSNMVEEGLEQESDCMTQLDNENNLLGVVESDMDCDDMCTGEKSSSSSSDVEELDEDKLEEESISDYGNDVMDEVQACESHSSKCNIDYRLYTFQDIGRYMKNNPGSYYDHSKNLWFCSICQNFGGVGKQSKSDVWVNKGVRLGNVPGRIFRRHFSSEFH